MGAAIDVPLTMAVSVSPVFQSEVMPVPGAKRSTQDPKFEYVVSRLSVDVVAATVSAAGTSPGLDVHASRALFPAAIVYVTPEAIELFTALSIVADVPPPRLRLATGA